MKSLVTVIGILLIVAVVVAQRPGGPEFGNYNVPLDHFRPQDTRVINFTYHLNIDHYDGGGPLFFYVSDGDVNEEQWIHRGLMYDIARDVRGALFSTSLRYFAENLPTPSASLENLQYLTIQQIVRDVANWIAQVRVQLENYQGQVFVWGSGFGGTLAVLARQQFPHQIDGAWSTGGIFYPSVFTTDNYDYLSSNVFLYGGDACGFRLRYAFEAIDARLNEEDGDMLIEAFNLCPSWNVSNSMDVGLFAETLIEQISNFVDTKHAPGIDRLCRSIFAIPSEPLNSLARWFVFDANADVGDCLNMEYSVWQDSMSNTNWNTQPTILGRRQLSYLQCTEFGQLRTTNPYSMFGNRVTQEYRQNICKNTFSQNFGVERLQRNVADLVREHGGRNPAVTRVIFSNGMLDPWLPRGITQSTQNDTHVINIQNYGKSADLESISIFDSINMYNAKSQIKSLILGWINA